MLSLLLISAAVCSWLRSLGTAHWPHVKGEIIVSEILKIDTKVAPESLKSTNKRADGETMYSLHLVYAYEVMGMKHENSRISFYDKPTQYPDTAQHKLGHCVPLGMDRHVPDKIGPGHRADRGYAARPDGRIGPVRYDLHARCDRYL